MDTFFEDFCTKAKDVADAAAKKTGELVEISKYKIEASKINSEIRRTYEQLGSSVYSMVKGGYDNQELVNSLAEDIDELFMRLDAVNEKLSELKNAIICPVCGKTNAKDSMYCSKCGSKLQNSAKECDCDCCADDSDAE